MLFLKPDEEGFPGAVCMTARFCVDPLVLLLKTLLDNRANQCINESSVLGRISLLIQNIDNKNLFLFRTKKKKQGFSP